MIYPALPTCAPGSGGAVPAPHAEVPALLRTLPDPASVLREFDGERGQLLWQALQDVTTWAVASAAERPFLFATTPAEQRRARLERVAPEPEVATPLALLLDLTANPGGMPPLLVTHACLRLARHLAGRGAGASALSFVHAAALASPDHPRPALEVGRLLGPARQEESRVWLCRALALVQAKGGGAGEPQIEAHAHAELAALRFRRGEVREAVAHLLAALRAARRLRRSACTE